MENAGVNGAIKSFIGKENYKYNDATRQESICIYGLWYKLIKFEKLRYKSNDPDAHQIRCHIETSKGERIVFLSYSKVWSWLFHPNQLDKLFRNYKKMTVRITLKDEQNHKKAMSMPAEEWYYKGSKHYQERQKEKEVKDE